MKPFDHENPFRGVRSEIGHAISSLNMPAKPKPISRPGAWLSETDLWAEHAMEHLQAAIDNEARTNEAIKAVQRVLLNCYSLLCEGDVATVKTALADLAVSDMFYS